MVKNPIRIILVLTLAFVLLASSNKGQGQGPWILSAPAGERYTVIHKNGQTIIPNGRILTPAGTSIVVAPHPYGLAYR